ncbi:MAG: hypothetical protein QF767_08610 [Alphaproteobacteria bacterium]|nr:hypothetical protein [Alphaproteobacteria bacterium]
MRFSDNGYYIERYIKCDNCGVLLYEDGLKGEVAGEAKLFCSDWCQQWASARAAGSATASPSARAATVAREMR